MREDKKICSFGPDSPYVDLAAEVFRLLADPTRIRIILALREAERSVNELAEAIGKSPTTVSQHLAKLRWGRIVATRQDGTRVFYRLQDEHARELVAQAVFQAEHALDDSPAHHRAGVDPEARRGATPTCPARSTDDTSGEDE
ncbi:ArsR/SmtB family transcription factor [Nocardiopsis alba]|uniref:ArsR/SmtB family transcription factor n=1 Tax=Nocardiopsis alba TaxID=53437 RepID=UPI0036723E57